MAVTEIGLVTMTTLVLEEITVVDVVLMEIAAVAVDTMVVRKTSMNLVMMKAVWEVVEATMILATTTIIL